MTELAKSMIKEEVTELLKQFMAKEIDEQELIDRLNKINNDHKRDGKELWYRWHDEHALPITVDNIKAWLYTSHRGYLYECIEATVNDNSLVVNFS
jgi:hypothetical protein